MNAKELAEKLGVHYNTIYKKIKAGDLNAKKMGKSYEVDDIDAYNLIQEKIFSLSTKEIEFGIDVILNFLNEEKRSNFRFFLQGIEKILDKYNKSVDEVDELSMNSFWLQPNVIECLEDGIVEFKKLEGKRISKYNFGDSTLKIENYSIKEYIENMEKIENTISVIEKFKKNIISEFKIKKRNQEYIKIKNKLNKSNEDGILIKDFLENIEIDKNK